MSATAIILARAGSKGLSLKNVREVGGKPCIAWTIEHAQACTSISRVIVSTDDPRASDIARGMGAETSARPPSLATDDATVDAAARDVFERASIDGNVVILYANVPVRPSDLTERALSKLTEHRFDSVQSFQRVGKHHPWWTCRIDSDGRLTPWEGETLYHGTYRRQDLPPAYIPDGGVLACTPDALLLRVEGATAGPHAFLGVRRGAIDTSEGDVIDIDSEIDLHVADAILRERRGATRVAN